MARKGICIIAAGAAMLGGCSIVSEPIAAALAGAGASTAIGHSMNGTAYRTFTASLAEVKTAALDTLSLMGIRVDGFESSDHSETVLGSAYARRVEIELEPISSKATRMRVVTRNGGIFYDAATATEIVMQTEKALGVYEITNSSTGSSRRKPR
jgi:hypothetical protein